MRSHRGDLRLSNPDWNELLGGIRWLLRDTKNRSDHKPLLSTDMDARKTLRWIRLYFAIGGRRSSPCASRDSARRRAPL